MDGEHTVLDNDPKARNSGGVANWMTETARSFRESLNPKISFGKRRSLDRFMGEGSNAPLTFTRPRSNTDPNCVEGDGELRCMSGRSTGSTHSHHGHITSYLLKPLTRNTSGDGGGPSVQQG